MNNPELNTDDRRNFVRLEFITPLACKVCKQQTLSKLLEGYTSDISQSGLFCNIKDEVAQDDIIWLSFDRATLVICEELEKRSLIYQSGIIGKVIRVERQESGMFGIGIQFVTREEKSPDFLRGSFSNAVDSAESE